MTRYINTSDVSEAIPGFHCPHSAAIPEHWQALADDHWFWQPLPAGYRVVYEDGVLSLVEVESLSIEGLRDVALSKIIVAADAAMAPATASYPRGEIDSWPAQCAEARSWLNNPSVSTPLLSAIAGSTDTEALEALARKILSKANDHKVATGAVIAWRRACAAWVDAQTEPQQLIDFSPQFPEVPHD